MNLRMTVSHAKKVAIQIIKPKGHSIYQLVLFENSRGKPTAVGLNILECSNLVTRLCLRFCSWAWQGYSRWAFGCLVVRQVEEFARS